MDIQYFKGLRIISKEEFTYIDHNFKLLKNKTIQNTYFILLSSENICFDTVNTYNFYEEKAKFINSSLGSVMSERLLQSIITASLCIS